MKSFLLTLALLVAAGCPALRAAVEKRPNVLFLISDDLNNYLGCYGDPQELVNLAGKAEHAGTVAQLGEQLRAAVKNTFPADGKTPELKEGLWAPLLVD